MITTEKKLGMLGTMAFVPSDTARKSPYPYNEFTLNGEYSSYIVKKEMPNGEVVNWRLVVQRPNEPIPGSLPDSTDIVKKIGNLKISVLRHDAKTV